MRCITLKRHDWSNRNPPDTSNMGQGTQCNNMAADEPTDLEWFRDTDSPLECSSQSSQSDTLNTPLPTLPEPPLETMSDANQVSTAQTHEESTREALILKRQELKWKLMIASQAQNKLKLQEYKTAYHYHKQKLSKAEDLAAKLRSKYLKVVQSAKLTETQMKKAEGQLSLQEKHVAEQKMQSTRLALDCVRTGTKLYGTSYKLPTNKQIDTDAITRELAQRKRLSRELQQGDELIIRFGEQPALDDVAKRELMDKLSPFLRTAKNKVARDRDVGQAPSREEPLPAVRLVSRKQAEMAASVVGGHVEEPAVCHTVPQIDLNDSILKNLASYRLTREFAKSGVNNLTSTQYAHNISPLEFVCLPDLLDKCSDKSCTYQHKSNYFMTDLERLTDILSYRPTVAGFQPDPDLSLEDNYKICQIKLKQFAARLISKHAEKSVETIARGLIDEIRAGYDDQDLLLMKRFLPKASHLKLRAPIVPVCDIPESHPATADHAPASLDQPMSIDF